MGIGNVRSREACCAPNTLSLPLMGIGNSCYLGHREMILKLITPHGDWKREKPYYHDPAQNRLITPHGDWKPVEARKGNVTAEASLPLMGIGNPGTPSSGISGWKSHYPSWGLETQPLRPAPPMFYVTHYPSWGLETCAPSQRFSPGILVISLPLMGIGNLLAKATGQAVEHDSLPLMGIGNAETARLNLLSTPSHYPSWGLETQRRTDPYVPN